MTHRALVVAVGAYTGATTVVDDPAAPQPYGQLAFVAGRALRCAAALRGMGYQLLSGDVRVDLNRRALRCAIEEALEEPGPVVVHFIGHGGTDRASGAYHIAGTDAWPHTLASSGVNLSAQLDRADANPDGPAVLWLVDACGSGRLVRYAMGQDRRDDDRRAWVMSAAHAYDPAFTGRFTAALTAVLERIAGRGVDIAASERYVRLEKIRDLVQERLDGEPKRLRQVVEVNVASSAQPAPPFVPNPWYDPVAAKRRHRRVARVPDPAMLMVLDEVVDPLHFRTRAGGVPDRAARPVAGGLPRCLFTGRARVMAALVAWLSGARSQPGSLRVVTGSPGSGKSAVLGALVCSAHPVLSTLAPEVTHRLLARCRAPRIASMVVVHARNRQVAEVSASIARQLGAPAGAAVKVDRLVSLAGRREEPPVVVIDALDEAADPDALLADLVLPLVASDAVRILAGTRPWDDQFGPLLEIAAARGGLVDLDRTPGPLLRQDLTAYLDELLAESAHYRADVQLRGDVAGTVADALTRRRTGSEYLVAGLFADYLDGLPGPVPGAAGVRALVPDSLDKVLEMRLAALGTDQPWMRPVLAVLARARGAGMPRTLLAAGAAAFAEPGPCPEESTVAEVLDSARFYLRRAVDADGTVLYRLFHQAFNDQLRAYPRHPRRSSASPSAEAGELLDRLLDGLRVRGAADGTGLAWDRAEPYLHRYAAAHAAEAGRFDDLLMDPRFLAHAIPDGVLPYLADAGSNTREYASVYRTSVHRHRGSTVEGRRQILAVDAARWRPPARPALDRPPWGVVWATGSHLDPTLRMTLSAGDRWIRALAVVTVDSRSAVACCGADGLVEVLDLTTGRQVRRIAITHSDWVNAVAVATVAGRGVLLTGAGDGTVGAWDLGHGCAAGDRLVGHVGAVTAVAAATLGGRPVAVTGGVDRTVRLWDLHGRVPLGDPLTGHAGAVTAVAIATLDGRPVAVTGGVDRTVRLWDLHGRVPLGDPLTGHAGAVTAVAVTAPGGRPVAVTGGADCTVRRWDLAAGRQIAHPLTGHTDRVTALTAVNGSDPVVISAGADGAVWLWDVTSGRAVGDPLRGHAGTVVAVGSGVSDGRPVAVTGGGDRTVRLWDLPRGEPAPRPLRGHTRQVTAVAAAPAGTGTTVLSGGADGTVRRWQRDGGVVVGRHHGRVTSVDVVTLAGRRVAVTLGTDRTMRLWDLLTNRPLGCAESVTAVGTATVAGRPVVATGADDGTLCRWDLATGAVLGRPVPGHGGPVSAVATVAVDGGALAVTAAADGTLRAWDLATGDPLGAPVVAAPGPVVGLAAGVVDGTVVAAGVGADATARLWRPIAGHLTEGAALAGPDAAAVAIATVDPVHPRSVVVVGGADGMIRMWDAAAVDRLLWTYAMPDPVHALAARGDRLVVGFGTDVAVLRYTPGRGGAGRPRDTQDGDGG